MSALNPELEGKNQESNFRDNIRNVREIIYPQQDEAMRKYGEAGETTEEVSNIGG